ncbi:hypothetical protein [Neptunitalea lumnitzerae]|nr:hypothetical protein [Neptunitalea sp. Y10]
MTAIYVVYHRMVTDGDGIQYLWQVANQQQLIPWLVGVSLLSVFNWLFEVFKWKQLAEVIRPTLFKNAYQQTIGAQTLAILTPGRLGEYGGKALFYPKGQKGKVLAFTFYHNMHQLGITFVAGVLGLFYLSYTYMASFIVIGFLAMLMLSKLLKRQVVKGYSLQQLYNTYKAIPLKNRAWNMLLSVMRYIVFSHQFYLFLWVLQVPLDYATCMGCITAMYLLASLVPLMSLLDVVLKTGIAVSLFTVFKVPAIIVLGVTVLMWICNTGFPALLGTFVVGNFKLKSTTVC